MTIKQFIAQKGIREILHFTTNNGLTGILASGNLFSRPKLRENQYLSHVLELNSASRPEESEDFDNSMNWIDFINLSISEINKRFFISSTRSHNNSDFWWCILAFTPEIMEHKGVYFATTNNGYEDCKRGSGLTGLEALFAPKVLRMGCDNYGKPWWVKRTGRSPNMTTCEQAEVLYPGELSIQYLRKVYVETDEHQDIITGWLNDFDVSNVIVEVNPQKFEGKKN